MARINVTLPDAMIELVRREMPGLNVSGVLRGALAELVECPHVELACSCCGAVVERQELVDVALSRFFQEVMWQLREPVGRCATAEGAARVVAQVARSWEVPVVDRTPLPRPNKSQRARFHMELMREAEREELALFASGSKPKRRAAGAA